MKQNKVVILGIDPGLKYFGYSVLEHSTKDIVLLGCGEICNESSNRLLLLFDVIEDLIKSYKPDICVIEQTFVNKNPLSSLSLGQARGIFLLSLQKNNIPYVELTPAEVKKQICGYGKAEKIDIQYFVKGFFDVFLGEHCADATAVALCACPSLILQAKTAKDLHKDPKRFT